MKDRLITLHDIESKVIAKILYKAILFDFGNELNTIFSKQIKKLL